MFNGRVGLGTDLHRLEPGRSLVIGGVEIPADRGAVGHSDGDVALHALADAILGAAGAGDIGELFPDTDESHRGIDSRRIVEAAVARVHKLGFQVINVDIVVELERPRLLPHRDAVRKEISRLLAIPETGVGFKAKTGEGLGLIGEGRAVAARAVALLSTRVEER